MNDIQTQQLVVCWNENKGWFAGTVFEDFLSPAASLKKDLGYQVRRLRRIANTFNSMEAAQ